jgi:LmbE family N-acetylglucosaminyl deacetylase
MAAANGQNIVNVTATRGELGAYDEDRWPSDMLAGIRTAELQEAFKILGIPVQIWMDYPDGGCDKVDQNEAVEKLKEIIAKVQPDSIITFGPDGLTGHTDHAAVSEWARQAGGNIPVYQVVQDREQYDKYLKKLDQKFNIYFNTDQPPLKDAADCDIALRVTPKFLHKKLEALRAMPSQYHSMFEGLDEEQLERMFDMECFVKNST